MSLARVARCDTDDAGDLMAVDLPSDEEDIERIVRDLILARTVRMHASEERILYA